MAFNRNAHLYVTVLSLLLMRAISSPGVHSDQGTSLDCGFIFKVEKGDSIDVHLHNFTKLNDRTNYCSLQMTANKNMRIVMDLVYSPPRPSRHLQKVNCSTDYVHVGNDAEFVDVQLMTSYKFCEEEVQHELISRANHMWLVYRASRLPENFFVRVQAKSAAMCTKEQFSCSPVQCVDRSRVCDGIKDCTNGHDEFCHRTDVTSNTGAMLEPCFRCGDGTCIQPRLSRYDISYGRVLWYLCDGFSHCPDAWDERSEICRHLQKGRVGSVTECVPSDLQFGKNGSVLMWNEVRCDTNIDCYNGEDETQCWGNARGPPTALDPLHADPGTIATVAAVVVIGVVIFLVGSKMKSTTSQGSRPSTSSTVDTRATQCTSIDSDTSQAAASGHKEDEPIPIDLEFDDNYNMELDKDGEGQSFTSQNLKYSVV